MTDVRVVLVTAPPGEPAAAIAHRLVDERLAACANVVPGVRSIYRWQGQVCDDGEALLVIKTTVDRLDSLVEKVREIHPYEVPEVLVLPVETGAAAYLDWVRSETRPA